MKKLFWGSLLGIAFLTTHVSCQNTAKQKPTNESTQQATPPSAAPVTADLTVADFQKKLNADHGAIVLDVRTPQEFADGHLPNAKTINFFDADFKEKVGQLDKTKPVYVYCAAGGRSSSATKVLKESGFSTVYNMVGGFSAWSAAGLPSER